MKFAAGGMGRILLQHSPPVRQLATRLHRTLQRRTECPIVGLNRPRKASAVELPRDFEKPVRRKGRRQFSEHLGSLLCFGGSSLQSKRTGQLDPLRGSVAIEFDRFARSIIIVKIATTNFDADWQRRCWSSELGFVSNCE